MTRRGERGAGTLLVAVAGLGVALLVAVALVAAGFAWARHRVDGAADLAAIAGAQAQRGGEDACAAARASARANDVELDACAVAGDEVEFVVSVRTSLPLAWRPWADRVAGQAHAGVVTGAPE